MMHVPKAKIKEDLISRSKINTVPWSRASREFHSLFCRLGPPQSLLQPRDSLTPGCFAVQMETTLEN